MNIAAVILARGGSKEIPKKNIINLNNKKVGPMDEPLFNRVRAMCEEHSSLPAPDNLGRRIGWA